MKKYLLLVILILIAVMPVFSQAESYFGFGFGFGGGTAVGFQLTLLGIQFWVEFDSPFNFLFEASGGLTLKEHALGLHYHLGGLIEYRIDEIFFLGAGGGMGGGILFDNASYPSYPYIRGSASIFFSEIKLELYYDYGFEYGSMFGFMVHLCFIN